MTDSAFSIRPYQSDDAPAIADLIVAEDYRGSDIGVANRLLDHLISEARQRGVLEIYLGTTADFKAAHRFYEKNGFVVDKVFLKRSVKT